MSPREHEVLRLVADGLSNEGIAKRLHVSGKTVESTMRSIFIKLELADDASHNRRVLAATLFRDHSDDAAGLPPRPYDGFFGRAGVLDVLTTTIENHRVVAVVGPGGIGKSRLAAEWSAASGAGATRWVDLAPVRSATGAWAALFAAFGITGGDRPFGLRRLTKLAPASIVVLDNADRDLAWSTEAAAELQKRGVGALVLTSRTPPGVRGEFVLQVGPLDFSSSCDLLVDRLRRLGDPDPVATVTNPKVTGLCRRCDGMPLVVELLAGRLARLGVGSADPSLSLPRLLSAIDGAGRGGLATSIATSLASLSEFAQRACRRLAVFVDGFGLSAASELLASEPDQTEVVLAELAGASLVVRSGDRFRLLEPIREFGLDELVRTGERAEAERALVAWATALALERRAEQLAGAHELAALVAREVHNLEAALDVASTFAVADDALFLLALLGWSWATSRPEAALDQARRVMPATGRCRDPEAAASALAMGGAMASMANDPQAIAWLEQALPIFESLDDLAGQMMCHFWLGRTRPDAAALALARSYAIRLGRSEMVMWTYELEIGELLALGELDEAARLLDEAPTDVGVLGDGLAHDLRSILLTLQGAQREARRHSDIAIRALRQAQNGWQLAIALTHGAYLAEVDGDTGRAIELLDEQVELAAGLGVGDVVATASYQVAALAWRHGQHDRALALVSMARQLDRRRRWSPLARRFEFFDVAELIDTVAREEASSGVDAFDPVLMSTRDALRQLRQDFSSARLGSNGR